MFKNKNFNYNNFLVINFNYNNFLLWQILKFWLLIPKCWALVAQMGSIMYGMRAKLEIACSYTPSLL